MELCVVVVLKEDTHAERAFRVRVVVMLVKLRLAVGPAIFNFLPSASMEFSGRTYLNHRILVEF